MSETPLDAAADRLARRLLAAHPATRAYGRADLDALPSAVARVLAVGLDHTAASLAREVRPETPWLDAEAPALTAAVAAWAEAVQAAVQYPAEAWAEAVGAASQVALRLLVHPADGLAAVAFDGDEAERPADAVLARVRAASPYGYLPEVATRYAERKGVETLDRPALERLLARIDRRMTDALGPDEWRSLAEPLFETAGPEGTLPAALVRAFFEARGHGARLAALAAADVSRETLRAALAASMPADAYAPERPALDAPAPAFEQVPGEAVPRADAPVGDSHDPDVSPVEAPAVELPAVEAPEDEPVPSRDAPSVVPADADPAAAREASGVDDGLPLEAARPAEPRWADAPPTVPEPSAEPWEAEWSEPGAVPETAVPAAPEPSPLASPPAEDTGAEEPLWQRLARQHAAATAPPAAPGGLPSPSGPPPSDEPPPLWQRFAADAPPPTVPDASASDTLAARFASVPDDASGRDVPPGAMDRRSVEARVLGRDADERRDWYIAELFDGDAAAYEATLARLDAAGTWTAATQIIAEDVFRRYRVHIYDDAAVAFTDAVEAALARRGPARP